MTLRLTLKRQSFTQVSPEEVERARTAPDVLKDLVSSPNRRRTGLDIYWHAVPYLLTGLPQNIDEPYRWFMEGGEILGKNDAGDIRYLSPRQAMKLAAALEDEPPDELGQLAFDEAKMDRLGIYPSRWVAWSDSDHLGTMRELYSYMRELISSSKQTGLLIHLDEETIDDDVSEPTAAVPQADASPAATLSGKLLLKGEEDNRYHQADASTHPKATATILRDIQSEMKRTGYSVTGDFTTSSAPGDTICCFISDDRTVIAIKYISTRGGRLSFLL
jgi:hypothetical protein